MPGLLKNPVFDDSVYAEPEDRAKRAASGTLVRNLSKMVRHWLKTLRTDV